MHQFDLKLVKRGRHTKINLEKPPMFLYHYFLTIFNIGLKQFWNFPGCSIIFNCQWIEKVLCYFIDTLLTCKGEKLVYKIDF